MILTAKTKICGFDISPGHLIMFIYSVSGYLLMYLEDIYIYNRFVVHQIIFNSYLRVKVTIGGLIA